MKKRMHTLLFAFLLLGITASYAGQSYYVAPNGNDADGAGSIGTPWRTLAYAISVVSPGDTIFMRGGTYQMDEVYVDRNRGRGGAPGNYLTIKAYPGEEPVLNYRSRRLIIWADYVRVEGLYFTGTEDLWRCDAFGTGLQIVNNKFIGPQPQYGAIETGGTNILIEGNEIVLDDGGNTRDHGIYVHAGNNITIRNNSIVGSQGYGIHVFDQPRSTAQNVTLRLQDYVIEGNYVAGSRTRAGIIVAKTDAPANNSYVIIENIRLQRNVIVGNTVNGLKVLAGTGIEVYNNTFYQNDYAQIYIEGQLNVDIKNNIFANGEGPYRQSGTVALSRNLYYPSLSTNIQDPNPLVANPLFMDPTSDDFHLSSPSPAIDAGVDVGLPFSGTAPDIGAYEFDDSPTTVEDPTLNPNAFTLHQNYPNPFNPETNIVYEISAPSSYVTISIYDIMGRKIKTLVDESKSIGTYTVKWNGADDRGEAVASGVYYYRLQAFSENNSPIFNATRRMILLR